MSRRERVLDAMVSAYEESIPDCEVGEPHMCPTGACVRAEGEAERKRAEAAA